MKTIRSIRPGNAGRKVETSASTPEVRLKTILAPTDFSRESLIGVRYAAAWAKQLQADVVLVNVTELPPRLPGLDAVVLVFDEPEAGAYPKAQLRALARRESKGDVAITTSVYTGKPFHEIAKAAREHAADLIVIATHGYTGAKHMLLGSTAEHVVRHAPCPVLTVRGRATDQGPDKAPPIKIGKILVPIDFSPLSRKALPWVPFLAQRFGAEIVLLHVLEKFPDESLVGHGAAKDPPLAKVADAALDDVATSLSETSGGKVTAMWGEGKPFEEICQTARRLNVDMIVLTSHGFTGLQHVLLGSTAERVVRHAHCPVLVVRERSADRRDSQLHQEA